MAADGEVRLVELTEHDEARLQALIESDPGYAERITGYPPGPSDAVSLLISRPPDLDEDDKIVRGIVISTPTGDELAGVLDVLRGWPDEHTVHVGLLLVHLARRRQGIGRRAVARLTELARTWPGITGLRVALVQANAGESDAFWASCGFSSTGERVPYRYAHVDSVSEIHHRALG